MGQSAEELRREIERTRGELSEDLEAIGDRVSPRRMVERRTNRVKDALSTGRERIFGRAEQVRGGAADAVGGARDSLGGAVDTVRQAPHMATEGAQGNPLAAGAVAFGMGFLVAAMFPGSQTEAQAAQRLGEAARPLSEGATDAVREVPTSSKVAGREEAGQSKQSATEHAQQVKQTATDETQSLHS